MKKNWREIAKFIIIFNAIFWMFAVAPFGYWFRGDYFGQVLRIVTIFLSTILLLYLIKK